MGLAAGLFLWGGGWLPPMRAAGTASILKQLPRYAGSDSDKPADALGGRIEINDRPDDFVLDDLDGRPHSLHQLRGQPVMLNFWATWCAPCRAEMPELQAAFQKYQDQGLVILAINFDEPEDRVRQFFYDELGLTFTPLLDKGGTVFQRFGVFNLPATFFLDRQGTVAAIQLGPISQSQIEKNLSLIMADE